MFKLKLTKTYILVFSLIIELLLLWPGISWAEQMINLYLYFDLEKNEILLDKEAAKNIELKDEISPYTLDVLENPKKTDYYFILNNFNGGQSDPLYFQPNNEKFVLRVPYVEGGSRVDIYYQNVLKLSVDISIFAVCNINNRCESQKGENAQNCIADCFALEVDKIKNNNYNNSNAEQNLEPSEPLTPGKKDEAATQATTETKTPYFGLIVGSLMILGGIGYGVYALLKRRR